MTYRSVCWLFLAGFMCCANISSATAQAPGAGGPSGRRAAKPTQPAQAAKQQVAADEAEQSTAPEDKPKSDEPPDPSGPITAIRGATVHTMSAQGTIREAVVLIQHGKILAVGDGSLAIPEDATQIDASGLEVTPGLIDGRSSLWMDSAASRTYANDASLNVMDGVDPFAQDWSEVLSRGVTAVYLQPASTGTLGGFGALLTVAPSTDNPGGFGPAILDSETALQASLGRGASNNQAREKQLEGIKKVLDGAAAYQKQLKEYEAFLKKKTAGEASDKKSKDTQDDPKAEPGSKSADRPARSAGRGGRPAPGRGGPSPSGRPSSEAASGGKQPATATAKSDENKESKAEAKEPKKPEKDPIKDQLIRVLEGEIPIRLEIHTADDAFYAKQLLEAHKNVQVIFEGVTQLGSMSDAMLELRSPLVLGPWLAAENGYEDDPDAAETWAGLLDDYDGVFAITTNSDTPRGSRLLRAHVGNAIAAGITAERALRAVTLDAARVLGVSDRLGSIEPGKRADLVAFSGAPTNAASSVSWVICNGKTVFETPAGDDPAPASSLVDAELELPTKLPSNYYIKTQSLLMPDGNLLPRIVAIENGAISDILPVDAELDSQQTLVDVGQAVVTPGLTSAHANLGLTRLIEPSSQVDAGYIVAADCVASGFEQEMQRVQSGLLTAVLAPGNSNPMAGVASIIHLGSNPIVAKRSAATKLVLTSAARNPSRFPSSLAGQLQMLNQSIAGKLLETRDYLPKPLETRLVAARAASFAAIVGGEQAVIIAAESDAEIKSALGLIEKHNLKAALLAPRQLSPFIAQLKQLNVAVIARPSAPQDYAWYAGDLAEASQAGVNVMFAGESAEQLRLTAALSVQSGMLQSAARRGLFQSASEFCGVASFAAQAPANFVVWSADPLHLGARPLAVVVDGQIVPGGDK